MRGLGGKEKVLPRAKGCNGAHALPIIIIIVIVIITAIFFIIVITLVIMALLRIVREMVSDDVDQHCG